MDHARSSGSDQGRLTRSSSKRSNKRRRAPEASPAAAAAASSAEPRAAASPKRSRSSSKTPSSLGRSSSKSKSKDSSAAAAAAAATPLSGGRRKRSCPPSDKAASKPTVKRRATRTMDEPEEPSEDQHLSSPAADLFDMLADDLEDEDEDYLGGEDEDEEEDDGGEEEDAIAQQAASGLASSAARDASAALHGLLMQLGAGSRLFGGGQSGRFKTLLEGLQAMGDDVRQQQALQEITELLLMGTEETLHGLRVDQTVEALHAILDMEYQPQMALMACRALANMLEALPRSSTAVATCIPSLCNKLLLIEYIDLAEQSLTTLNKLSRDQSSAILKAGGMNACLLYLDFFSLSLQRTSLSTASNLCEHVTAETFDLVRDAIPVLSTLLQHKDKALVESACMCFSRLVHRLRAMPDMLVELTGHGLVSSCLQLITEQQADLSDNVFTTVVRMLWTLCQRCHTLVEQFHREAIGTRLCALLRGDQDKEALQQAGSGVQFTLSSKHLLEIVKLISELLPALPGDMFYEKHLEKAKSLSLPPPRWSWQMDSGTTWRPYSRHESRALEDAYSRGDDNAVLTSADRQYVVHFDRMVQVNRSTGRDRPVRREEAADLNVTAVDAGSDPRAKLFEEEPELLKPFGEALLGVLFDIYLSSAASAIRHACLEALVKLCHFGSASLLKDLMESVAISAYLSDLLSSGDPQIILGALQMANSLMDKLPDIFHVHFRRKGVVHQLHLLTKASGQSQDKTKVKKRRSSKSDAATSASAAAAAATPEPEVSAAKPSRRRSSKRASLGASAAAASSAASASEESGSSGLAKLNVAMHEEAVKQAKALVAAHFANSSEDPVRDLHPAMNTLRSLKKLADRLLQPQHDSEGLRKVIIDVAGQLEAGEISSFETLQSGLVSNLLKLLSDSEAFPTTRMHRLEVFASVMYPDLAPGEESTAAAKLVDRLHGCLNTVEQFRVRTGHNQSSAGSILTTPLKLKLERDPRCTNIKEFPPQIVLIDPLASIQAIEDFLWPRVRLSKEERAKTSLTQKQLRKLRSSSRTGSSAEASASATPEPEAEDHAAGEFDMVYDDDDEDEEEQQRRQQQQQQQQQQQGGSSQQRRRQQEVVEFDAAGGAEAATVYQPAQQAPRRRLTICLDGKPLPSDITIYQAIKASAEGSARPAAASRHALPFAGVMRFTEQAHTLKYRPFVKSDKSDPNSSFSRDRSKSDLAPGSVHAIEKMLFSKPLPSFNAEEPTTPILQLIRILAVLNSQRHLLNNSDQTAVPYVSSDALVNNRLSAKLVQQVSDFDALCQFKFPSWCKDLVRFCPYVVSFNSRLAFLHYTAFGCVRGLQRYKADHLHDTDPDAQEAARLSRTKVRIARDKILSTVRRIVRELPMDKTILEVEYFDEVGTGLGPTLEFFSLVCKVFQERRLRLWVDSTDQDATDELYVNCPTGLFPRPRRQSDDLSKEQDLFETLGRFTAKAILDSRLLDLPFSSVFYSWLLGEEDLLSLADLQIVDPVLHASCEKLSQLCKQKRSIEADKSLSAEARRAAVLALELDGVSVDDLCLSFTLPGFSDVELKPSGADIAVTIDNLQEYVELLPKAYLVRAVSKQMVAFLSGFNAIVPVDRLQCFTREELHLVFNGCKFTPWKITDLAAAMKTDHGYTSSSPEIALLCEVLSGFDAKQQRQFVSFVTGAPNLPVGGFASLRPPLTVVRKQSDTGSNILPSVMTCQNYLKLPPYPSLDIMREKLVQAMTEGQGSFHLS